MTLHLTIPHDVLLIAAGFGIAIIVVAILLILLNLFPPNFLPW